MLELVYMVVGVGIFYVGYRTGQQNNKLIRREEAVKKNIVRNMYNDIRDFIKPEEDEIPRKDRKTPEQAEQDEKGENLFFT